MKDKLYYGWVICMTGCLGNVLQGGLIIYSMGMYASTFEDIFDASRARIAIIETCFTIGVNVMSPVLGYLVDKRSARHVMALGAISLGLGLILISQAGKLFHMWVLFATLIPLGALSLGMLPSSTLITRWFRRRRGLALGISLTGTSIGGTVAPPLLAFLFASYGWRTALLIVGISVIALAPLIFFTMRNSPADLGLKTEAAAPAAAPNASEYVEWPIKSLLKTPSTYLQALYSGLLLAIFFGLITNLGFHMKDLGFAPTQSGFVFSIIAACSFAGKIVFGTLIDRIGPSRAGMLAVSSTAAGLATFLLTQDFAVILLAAGLMGLGAGGNTPVWNSLIARDFGPKSFGRALGIQSPMHIPITAPAAPIAGYVSDTTGSYELIFMVYLGMCAVAIGALFLMRKPPPVPAEAS